MHGPTPEACPSRSVICEIFVGCGQVPKWLVCCMLLQEARECGATAALPAAWRRWSLR